FETKVVPTGVGSLTTTFCALFGPLLTTTIVNVAVVFSSAVAGPVLVTLRSATSVPESDVVATAMLLLGLRSAVELLTVAILVIVVAVNAAGTLYVEVIVTLCAGFSVPSAHGYG